MVREYGALFFIKSFFVSVFVTLLCVHGSTLFPATLLVYRAQRTLYQYANPGELRPRTHQLKVFSCWRGF